MGYNDALSVATDIVDSVGAKLGQQSSVTTETILSSLLLVSSMAVSSASSAAAGANAASSSTAANKAAASDCPSSSMASSMTDKLASLSFVLISSLPLRVGVCSKLLLLSLEIVFIGATTAASSSVDDRLELTS